MRGAGLPAGREPAEIQGEGTGFEVGLAQPQISALALRSYVALGKWFTLSEAQLSVMMVKEMIFVKHRTLPSS